MSDINGSKPTNFPLDESSLSFTIPRTDAPRKDLLKLGSMITNRIGLKATADDPEYWGLAGVMTDEMVSVALKMGVRKPKTTGQRGIPEYAQKPDRRASRGRGVL